MACPYYPEAPVTTRRVPVEVYGEDGTPIARHPDAQLEMCSVCGCQHYDLEKVLALPGQKPPWDSPPAPVYDAGDYC